MIHIDMCKVEYAALTRSAINTNIKYYFAKYCVTMMRTIVSRPNNRKEHIVDMEKNIPAK